MFGLLIAAATHLIGRGEERQVHLFGFSTSSRLLTTDGMYNLLPVTSKTYRGTLLFNRIDHMLVRLLAL